MRYKSESKRGRPNGKHRSQTDIRLLEYLAKVSMKYEVDSDRFFNSFLDASQHRKSKCGKLSIECRVREKDYTSFLMTRDREVVGQFRMPEYLLKEKTNLLKEFICRLSNMKTLAQEAKSQNYRIRDSRDGMRHLNINARALEVS